MLELEHFECTARRKREKKMRPANNVIDQCVDINQGIESIITARISIEHIATRTLNVFV